MTAEEYAELYNISIEEGRRLQDANIFIKTFGVDGSAYVDGGHGWYVHRYKISYRVYEGGEVKTVRYKSAESLLRGAKRLVLQLIRNRRL